MLSRIILVVLAYVVGYTIIWEKGYQEYEQLQGSSMMKMKGSGMTAAGRVVHALIPIAPKPKSMKLTSACDLCWQVDVYDMVIPPIMPQSVFIGTNFDETLNQTRSFCEGSESEGLCNCSDGNPFAFAEEFGSLFTPSGSVGGSGTGQSRNASIFCLAWQLLAIHYRWISVASRVHFQRTGNWY